MCIDFLTTIGAAEGFLSKLNEWDTWLFFKINRDAACGFLDGIAPIIRTPMASLPLYFFLLIAVFGNFGWKAWKWLAFVGLTILISDQLSSSFMKNFFNRPRPCNDETIKDSVRFLLGYRPQSGSFTSSHATNHFALGTYFYFTLKDYWKNWAKLFFVWAGLISIAQVYVGVHYPGDVIGGAILGYGIGWLTSKVFIQKFGLPTLLPKPLWA
ncbi:phosphatase PAP2 family protein [Rhizosphaericola mali]|uniref:Phosphatase PAP2 family protein n=1 Tax=Rhizosphaericola mali TaxID=2545455 RepID=A0A5P2FZ10_9BACT|nr:phosphatase PAP2 family protein [Rhizosphaericola mali]QES88167.1 phosphatase PAP2 family protein [Rhizosphaericola mali]